MFEIDTKILKLAYVSGATLNFEHSPSQESEIKHFEIFSHM